MPKRYPPQEPGEVTGNGRGDNLKDLQAHEDQGGVEPEGVDEFFQVFRIREEVDGFPQEEVGIPVVVKQQADGQEQNPIAE
jgi:hypothetical protein